jgi:hypothetical protein
MTTKSTLALKPGLIALMALMAATRFHHFGTPFALPDAWLFSFWPVYGWVVATCLPFY